MTDDAVVLEHRHPFEFTGRAGEYFRIWMISTCLSVLTLGVYSAWGKVRKKRYLYAHTRLDGDGFDYRASPIAILRGRIIAVVLFGGFALSGQFIPMVQIGFVLLLLVLSPWIVVASARFTARNSTYRNIAFAFDGRVGEAARVFIGGAIIAVVTLGIAFPWYRMRRAKFILENHRFGSTPFSTDIRASGFVATYVIAAAMIVAIVIAFAIIMMAIAMTNGKGDPDAPRFVEVVIVLLYAAYIAVYAYIRARTLNLTANATIIGSLRLAGSLRARRLAWLYLSNIVAILCTIGLATPWATIRVARYRAETLVARANAPLDSYGVGESPQAAATGSEVSDLFDVDVSL